MIQVKIEGAYENGHEYYRTVEIDAHPDAEAELDDWWEEYVYPFIGDGQEQNHVGYCHEAEITGGDPRWIGETYEWTGR